jgi:prolyl-tRNA synthetase
MFRHARREARLTRRRVKFQLEEVRVYADERLQGANDMTTGANEDGFHLRTSPSNATSRSRSWHDLRTVHRGRADVEVRQAAQDPPRHRSRPRLQARHKYSEKLGSYYLDEAGARQPA